MAGQGAESAFVAEKPQSPGVPATVASFSQTVTRAVKEDVRLGCFVLGQPKPTVTWKYK